MALQMTWKPSLLNQKRKSGPPLGLRNLGNTCYLNSVLQCLTYTPPLANFCLKFQHSSSCDSAKERDKKSGCPFCILEKRIARSLSTDITLDTPAKINSCLKIFAEHFKFGRQEDAHEFLRYVIDACHNTSLRLKKLQQHRGKEGSLSNGADSLSSNGNTVVKDIFGGALQSQVKCLSCGNESNKVDEIMDISLDILHSGSLKEALHKFFQPEVLDGNNKYKCDNCKKLVSARKQMSVLQAPNVLVIQLKRFEGVFGGKIDKAIAFEEVLVLPSYMCKESQDPYPEYNLFGTIVHSGFSPDSGHYYAYIKDAVGRWYCCNDSYVTLSNLQEVLSEKVYILFFIRTKQRSGCANSASITNRVKSHHACFSGDASKSTSSPVKSVNGKQFLNRHTGKDYSISSTVDKVPSNTPVKLGTVGNTGSKKNPSNVRFKIVVDKWKSIGKCNNVKVSTSVEKYEENISSFTDQNGVHKVKLANGSNSEKGTASPLSNGNRRYQASNGNSVEADSCLTDIRDSGAAGGGFNSQGLQNGSLSCISNNFGSKRKLQIGDLCVLPAKDYQSCALLEKLKQDFQKEAYLVLQSCGWTDEVYSFMRSRKKLCARELGIDASNMKRMLISDAKSIFIQQIPDSLKKSLIEHLKSFSQEKQGPTSGLMDHSKRVC